MIVEFAGNEAVGTFAQGLFHQKGSGTSAQGDSIDISAAACCMAEAFHPEYGLDSLQECRVAFRFWQPSHQSRAGVFALFGQQPLNILQTNEFRYLVVDSAGGIVQAGMRGINGNTPCKCLDDAALLVGGVADLAERLEQNNIICNYQATPEEEGFTASGALRLGVSEMTRFGFTADDFAKLADLMAACIKDGTDVSEEVKKLRAEHLEMQYCFKDADMADVMDAFAKKTGL